MQEIAPNARILIVRLSAIGDVMHTLPLCNALRDALPRAFLAWVVEGRTAELLRATRALDEVIVVPRRWLRSPRMVFGLRRELRELRFDVAIDVQGLSKSAIAARLSGARRRIGYGGDDGREISSFLNNELVVPTRTHIVERNLELLGPLGIAAKTIRFGLEDMHSAAIAVEKMLESLRVGGRFALICPGAGWPSKVWPPQRYAAVARHLGQSRLLRSVVVWAGDNERSWAEQIVEASAGFAAMAPPTSLSELSAMARRAAIYLGSDSGPLHVAAAVGTPCVGLFGPMPGERNGPFGPQNVVVQRVWLSGSSRGRRHAGPESMAAISVAHVTEACDQVLDSIRRAPVDLRPLKDVGRAV